MIIFPITLNHRLPGDGSNGGGDDTVALPSIITRKNDFTLQKRFYPPFLIFPNVRDI